MRTKIFTLFLALVASVGSMMAWDYEHVLIGDLYFNLDTEKQMAEVTYAERNAQNYTELSSANISKTVTYEGITYTVTKIGNEAFYYCSSLKSVTIPETVTELGYQSFAFCNGLTSLIIPNSVLTIQQEAFFFCENLASVTIPNQLTVIEKMVFSHCTALTSVNIPNSVTVLGDACFSYSGLTSVTIPESVTTINLQVFDMCKELVTVSIPNSVTKIGDNVFYGDTKLKTITIPDSATEIGENIFGGCTSLTKPMYNAHVFIYMPRSYNAYNYSIQDGINRIASYAFNYCKNVSVVNIPNSVTIIGERAFSVSDVTTVNMSENLVTIGLEAFSNCSYLNSITIPNTVTSIGGGAFCYTKYYNNAANWEDNVLYIGNYLIQANTDISDNYTVKEGTTCIADGAFNGCNNLTSLSIPDGVKYIGKNAFQGCTALTSMTIANSVISIGNNAFYNSAIYNNTENWEVDGFYSVLYVDNYLIKARNSEYSGEYTIKEGTIGLADYAFASFNKLSTITIPSSVKTLGRCAFYNCTELKYVTSYAIVPPMMGEIVFGNVECNKVPLFVLADSRLDYSQADQWKDFQPIMTIGEGYSAIDPISLQQSAESDQCQKILRDGQVFIQRGENIYDLMGRRVR